MSSSNQVQLIGNLGEDPELLKESDSGYFVRLSVATNKSYTDAKGETITKPQWHTVYLNNGLGKYAKTHYKKGHKVYVRGELENRCWKDKEGKKCYKTAVYAKECYALFKFKPTESVANPRKN